jgi:hypothetical protein
MADRHGRNPQFDAHVAKPADPEKIERLLGDPDS